MIPIAVYCLKLIATMLEFEFRHWFEREYNWRLNVSLKMKLRNRYNWLDLEFRIFDLIFGVQRHFQQYFSYIMVISFNGGRSRSTRREPPTMGKQLINFITCGCGSISPFFVIYKARREPMPYWWYACMSCWVIQLPNSLSHPGPCYNWQSIIKNKTLNRYDRKKSLKIKRQTFIFDKMSSPI